MFGRFTILSTIVQESIQKDTFSLDLSKKLVTNNHFEKKSCSDIYIDPVSMATKDLLKFLFTKVPT